MTYFCFCSGTVLVQTRHHHSGCPYFSVSSPPSARLRLFHQTQKKSHAPYFILRLYSFFRRNSLFTRDLDWYKVPNLSHRAFVVASPDTFNNTESETHNRIVLFAFRSNFFHSSSVTRVGLVPWIYRNPLIFIHQQILHLEFPQLKALTIFFHHQNRS